MDIGSKAKGAVHLPAMISKKFILSDKTQFVITEAYKTARTNLIFSMSPYDNKITVVTSCSPGEGKSTNCINLSIAMAQTGAKVLIIDADMRKPMIHNLLGLDNKIGLSSILGKITGDVDTAIHTGVRDNLDVMTSGAIPPNPTELLSSPRTSELLDIMSEYYDFIFIDTPPVTVVSDALLMNDKIAGIVFIVREGYTTHVAIHDALERVKMTNGRVLGFLKVACNAKGKSGYKSYKYKYKYENKSE